MTAAESELAQITVPERPKAQVIELMPRAEAAYRKMVGNLPGIARERDKARAVLARIFKRIQLRRTQDGGMVAVLEYFQNEAATRKWIAEGKYEELKDYLNKADESAGCSFLRYLIAATQQGVIDPGIARSATDRPQDFDRAMRGIS